MFSFMIVVNDNGAIKSVSTDELGSYGVDGHVSLLGNLEEALSSILDDHVKANASKWDGIVEHSFDETQSSD